MSKIAADYIASQTWFDEAGTLLRELPADCIKDIARPGLSADGAVTYWHRRLAFRCPRTLALPYLKSFGAWSTTDLARTENYELEMRVLWLLCCTASEYPEAPLTLTP
jgi:hypothetical protein